MKIIKKNQLTILVLALMLVTAGYLNYNSNITPTSTTEMASIGDATLVSSNISNGIENKVENARQENEVASSISSNEPNEETMQTNAEVEENNSSEYFSSSKLERETMYSQMLEAYQKILDSATTSNKQKEAAQTEIDKINKTKNSIMISENLIKTKGINEVVVFANDDSISIIVNKDELNKEIVAQIQSIIAREMNAKMENIHIMNK